MGYSKSIDEFTDLELAQEIEKREKMRAEGKCDYCYQPNTAPVCKYSARHNRDVVKVQTS